MSIVSEITSISYRRERSTGNMVASFRGAEVVLVANRSGQSHGFPSITSYTASVNGKKAPYACNLKDAKVFAGLELLDLFREESNG